MNLVVNAPDAISGGGTTRIETASVDLDEIGNPLPRYHHPAPALEVPTAAGGELSGSETILLVEDAATVRLLARIILQRAGYTVVDAASPADAESQWASIAPVDLLLTDASCPAEQVRISSAACPPAGLIFRCCSCGYADWDLFDRAGVAHPAAFLEKPFSAAALLAKVRQALDRDRP